MSRPLKKNARTSGIVRRSILVADDHVVVREGLGVILSLCPDLEVIGEASDGQEAVEKTRKLKPDLLLLDLRMPVLDGVDVVRLLLQENPQQRVLIVTTYETDEDIFNCIKAGAKGYILKDSPREIIIEAVREVARGESYTPARIATRLVARLSSPDLSSREQEVLRLMAEGLSNKEIGTKLFVSEGTVKSHAKSINVKLSVNSRTEAIAAGRRRGYLPGGA